MLDRFLIVAGSRLLGVDLAAILQSAKDSADNIDALLPKQCEQQCGADAVVYAIDPIPGGWGGYYCKTCATALKFQVTDRL